jgi:hypothetical protein
LVKDRVAELKLLEEAATCTSIHFRLLHRIDHKDFHETSG